MTGTISNVFRWNSQPTPAVNESDGTPGEAIREARIRSMNYSMRERGVEALRPDEDDREKSWFNGNGLAQEPPTRDDDDERKK